MKISRFASIILSILIFSQLIISNSAYAASSKCSVQNTGTSGIDYSSLPQVCADHGTIAIVLNIVFSVVGAVSVLVIVLAGFKFITSSGKPEEVAKAKDTILYAAIGLIICVLAVTIVSFIAGYI
ncbi:MAG TPA: pilin [Candidatus Dormibacteraeota bacterium]|nr:pilin [Candidatus Dormibacteraeota bacterium]